MGALIYYVLLAKRISERLFDVNVCVQVKGENVYPFFGGS